jgi:hypothetical protein
MASRLLSVLTLAVGCAQGPAEAPEAADSSAQQKTKDDGGTNGFFDYCDGLVLCVLGEGDCDSDLQCDLGLSCVNDIGDNFGLHWSTDVCAGAHCDNGVLDGTETAIDFGGDCGGTCGGTLGDHDYCRPGCECPSGAGDCDTDADCQVGLVCAENQGGAFGLHWSTDVCLVDHCDNGVLDADETAVDFGGADCGTGCVGQNGDQNGYCTPGCPCAEGEGDCDSDADCQAGLSCRLDMGGRYGIDPLHDVCLDTYTVADLQAGDLIVTEFMTNPVALTQAQAQYFEIYNTTNNAIDLNGLYVRDNVNQNFTVVGSRIVQPRSHFTFVRTATVGFVGGYDYPNVFFLAELTDQLILQTAAAGGTELDRVQWTGTWARQSGRSRVLGRNYYTGNNNVSTSWCIPQTTYGSGDYGSPNLINRLCP